MGFDISKNGFIRTFLLNRVYESSRNVRMLAKLVYLELVVIGCKPLRIDAVIVDLKHRSIYVNFELSSEITSERMD